jgi:hypothetical protein
MWSPVALERVQTLCLVPKGTRKRKYLQLDLHALACRLAAAQFKARSAPGQDTRSGQGALARRHTDGPLWAAFLKTTVMCKARRRFTTLLGILLELFLLVCFGQTQILPVNWFLDTDTGTGPIPLQPPVTVSRVNDYSGGALVFVSVRTNKRHHHQGLRYLST